ncbi:protein dispatched homolog 3 isoform X3 [Takifugu flavidus]|uniref:protein dispatched homolog 3 isoform X3 n=1 Tax=Takifugu flavidus TaxID=433684 RepID=UPI002544C437|nr:protein dispatched homolog 3 isoform X3 [Takifugu flavidus]
MDPADIHHALSRHGALLGQHKQLLQALVENRTHVAKAVADLMQQSCPILPPTIPYASTISTSQRTSSTHICDPESFHGDLDKCQEFLLQYCRYSMDVEETPVFHTHCGEEGNDEEDDGGVNASEQSSQDANLCGIWRVVAWIYTQPCASGVFLGVITLLPCSLFAYMLLYCPPLDIDLSYSAFEVNSHFSAERFNALTIAMKSQLGAWDRQRRDLDTSKSETLQELLIRELNRQEAFNKTDKEEVMFSSIHAQNDQRREDKRPEFHFGQGKIEKQKKSDLKGEKKFCDRNQSSPLIRRNRFAPNYYLQSQAMWKIELVFVAQGEGESNIFTPERLQTIHYVETLLMQQPQFHQFCWKPLEMLRDLPLGPSYCSPPSSLLSYLYPSERGGKIYYDGMGPDLADIQGSLSLAITHPQFYWYVDENLSPENLSSSLLRSEIHFGAPLPSYYSPQDRAFEQSSHFKDFVVQYAGILAKQSTSQVKVLYGGTELFDDEVRQTFHNDMKLAGISGACITALVYVLTSFSAFLTIFGLVSIGLSCLMALFLYHVVFGVQYLGILNGVAAFVIIGIGVDDVFVFISTFRQASHLRQLQHRMIYTIQTAGRATFLTSFTTAAAYAANTFSQLLLALGVPADASHPVCLGGICGASETCLAELVSWKLFSNLSPNQGPLSDEDEDDVALLSVGMEPEYCNTDGDAAILPLSGETPLPPPGQSQEGVVSTNLQWGLKRFVAEPVVAQQKTVLGVFLLVLLVSVWCCCLLRPATHTPLLFRRDTNLQTLLALRSNLSGQGISCPMCSGVFMEKPHALYNHTSSLAFRFPSVVAASSAQGSSGSDWNQTASLLTVYISTLELGASTSLYRFSLNSSTPSPWTRCISDHQAVSSFQAYTRPYRNYTIKLTVCVSTAFHPYTSWMLTFTTCNPLHGWIPDFFFYAASTPQQRSKRFYFAQLHLRPHSSRVCVGPPGCGVSSGSDGSTRGLFYSPLSGDVSSAAKVSKTLGFNPCSGGRCSRPAVRPLVNTGAMVFVVFGILGLNRTEHRDNHVIGDMGSIILDPDFDIFQEMQHLCQMCKAIGTNKQLVKPGGAQCLPSGKKLSSVLPLLHPECRSLPEPNLLPGQLSHGAVGIHGGKVRWLSMAFESTTYKGKSSFQTYSDFLHWENFIQEQLASLPQSSALRRGFQTCEHWKQIFMEIIGVESALWSLLLSLGICVAAVSVFTAHPLLLLPVLVTIIGVICLVVAIMYWLGWEMGAVEAISLSILVGSSVDYCLHLVEGYLLTGSSVPSSPDHNLEPASEKWRRTLEAVNHVGVAIVSSAVTTAISTVPLLFCVIVPFAKFGQIVAINTTVSILFTLTVTVAMLACMAPIHFSRTTNAVLKATLAVAVAAALGATLYWAGGQLGVLAWPLA